MNKFEALQPMFETNLRDARGWIPKEAWDKSNGEVGINMVFGISDDKLPARFLAGFIPGISLAEAFQSQKKPVQVHPDIRIFVPISLAQACGVSPEHAQQIKNEGIAFVERFQDIFHPGIHWFVDTEHAMTIDHKLHLNSLSIMALEQFEEMVKEEWRQIELAAIRRGNARTALMYASHGIIGWQDCKEISFLRFFDGEPKGITINCMSKAEGPFRIFHTVIRQIQSERANESHGVIGIDLFTTLCRRPHYQRIDIGSHQEPTLKDLLLFGFEKTKVELAGMEELSDKFKQASRDLGLISMHIENLRSEDGQLPNVEEFIQEVKRTFNNQE